MGMAEDGKFGDGYEAIFGPKGGAKTPADKKPGAKPEEKKPEEKKPAVKKK